MPNATVKITAQDGDKSPRLMGSPVLQRRGLEWTTTFRYIGLFDDLKALVLTKTGYIETRIQEYQFPWYTLEITYSGISTQASQPSPSPDSQIVTLYSLIPGYEQRSLWLLPKVVAEMQKIADPQMRARIKADIEALAAGVLTVNKVNPSTSVSASSNPVSVVALNWAYIAAEITAAKLVPGAAAVDQTVLQGLVFELGRGVDQYRVDTIVFSRKQLVPPGASTLANYSIMNRPMTTNSLIAFCQGIPSLILRNLQVSFSSGFWFAGAPDVQQIDANRIQVDQQWVYGDTYSTFIYGAPI